MARHVKPGPHEDGSDDGSHTVGNHDTHHESHRDVQHDTHADTHPDTHHDTHHDTRAVPVHDQRTDRVGGDHDAAREKFGGLNIGAAFFGWLVAIAVTILLSSIVGAVAAAVGATAGISQSEAQRDAGTVGIVSAAVLLAVLAIGYFAGGYVAGRMSRFDGARQGLGVWVIGLLVTIVAVVLGLVFGAEYNILDRVSLPRIPVPTDQLGMGGIITAVAVILATLLAAMAGGKLGHRYHNRVDRAAGR